MHRRILAASLTLALIIVLIPAYANVKVNGLFTDNAVLQQGVRIPVWGEARDGENVSVRIEGVGASTRASGGRWRVLLKPMKAGGPFTMRIQGDNTIELKNVMVGEVWICSGQSNMQWAVSQSANPQETIANSADSMLRLYTVPRQGTDQPLSDVKGNWEECGPSAVPGFSAVAYHFGRELRRALNVPVGLISTNVGGTPAEAWTSKSALEAVPQLAYYVPQGNGRKDPGRPCALYNGMIAPLIPYAIRGAIWYQGESNAGKAHEYRTLFPTMIRNWREDWAQGDFPFLFVQLAPFMKISLEPQESAWAELREAQHMTASILPKVGEAVITDVGEEADIHPKQKAPVGARLALAARALAYREKIEFSGPVFESMKVDNGLAILRFSHAEGITAPIGSHLRGFTIAGPDRKFYNAKAVIRGGEVVIYSDRVPNPAAVRYGWANFPVVNLENSAGLKASPFRTDDWPITTGPK